MNYYAVATGFGGGEGLFGDTCGAITGAVMALGAVHGCCRLAEGEDRKNSCSKRIEAALWKSGTLQAD